MKILLLNYEFPPIGGGAGKATYNLARELAALGHTVDVLTAKLKNQPAREDLEGFTVYRVFSWRKGIHDCGFRGAFTYVFFAITKFLRLTRRNKYDLIHYFFGLPTGFLSLLPGSHNQIPYFISLRGSDVPGYDKYNIRLQQLHKILRPLTRKIWKESEQIIALSESLKKTALLSAPSLKINVIPNGVDPLFLAPPFFHGKKKNVYKMITVARLVERKGIQDVLMALAELADPEISLLIVGTGSYESHLKKLCKDLSLQNVVCFYGFCHPQKLPELLIRHDVFILTSLAESFGTAFAEAMACGLPIIGSDTGGISDFVGKNNGILIKPGNIAQIKDAILQMKSSTDLKRIQQANREKIIRQFSWNSIAIKHISIYQGSNNH